MSTQQMLDGDPQGKKPSPLEPKDFFKFVLDTRNFEITNFWQRSNYFLVLNTGLAIGFFSAKGDAVWQFFLLILVLGTIVCFLWTRVALGSKFWQVHWESKLTEVERMYIESGILDGKLNLFSMTLDQVKNDVRSTLESGSHNTWASKFIDKLVIRKPSVTQAMVALSSLFTLAWFSLFLAAVLRCFP